METRTKWTEFFRERLSELELNPNRVYSELQNRRLFCNRQAVYDFLYRYTIPKKTLHEFFNSLCDILKLTKQERKNLLEDCAESIKQEFIERIKGL